MNGPILVEGRKNQDKRAVREHCSKGATAFSRDFAMVTGARYPPCKAIRESWTGLR